MPRIRFLLLAAMLTACGSTTGGDDSPDARPVVPPDAATKAGMDADAATDAGIAETIFVEDFLTLTNVDVATTSATIDTSAPGLAHGPLPMLDDDTGDGSEGAYASIADGEVISAGEHHFTSMTIAHRVTIAGDATLRIQGNLVISGQLVAKGKLTLIVGKLTSVASGGQLLPEDDFQLIGVDDSGVVVDGMIWGMLANPGTATTPAPSIDIRTRGPLHAGQIYAGTSPSAGVAAGDLKVRTYGDVSVAPNGVLEAGFGPGPGGRLTVLTEGNLSIGNVATVWAGGYGGVAIVRVGKAVTIDGGTLSCGGGGASSMELVVAETVDLTNGATIDGSGSAEIAITAGGLSLSGGSEVSVPPAAEGILGGSLTVNVAGPIDLTDTNMYAGDGGCMPGGALVVRADGPITLDNACLNSGGFSASSTSCDQGPGTPLLIQSGSTVTRLHERCVDSTFPGDGTPLGTITFLENMAPMIGPVDPALVGSVQVQSIALPIMGSPGAVTEATTTFVQGPGAYGKGQVLVSPDGTEGSFQPIANLTGMTLMQGWKYRAALPTRMFDAVTLDRIRIGYRP